jgi:hypothetical protein
MATPTATSSTTPSLVTFTNFNHVKLAQDNYPTGLPHIVPHLKGVTLSGYVDGSFPCPAPIITTSKDGACLTQANLAFLLLTMQDQILLGTVNSALSEKSSRMSPDALCNAPPFTKRRNVKISIFT